MYINVDVNTYFIRNPDPGDSWDIGDRDGEASLIIGGTRKGYNGIKTDLDKPFYVVYAEYYTGCTFGTDFDAVVIDAFDNEEDAKGLRHAAEEAMGYNFSYNGRIYHAAWVGYFEKLKCVRVEKVS